MYSILYAKHQTYVNQECQDRIRNFIQGMKLYCFFEAAYKLDFFFSSLGEIGIDQIALFADFLKY